MKKCQSLHLLSAIAFLPAATWLLHCGHGKPSEETQTPTTAAQPGFESALVNTTGCGDMFVGSFDSNGTLALTVFAKGFVEDAHTAMQETTSVIQLPDERITIKLLRGTNVSSNFCNDVYEPSEKVDTAEEPIAGTVTLKLNPKASYVGPPYKEADATVTFDNVQFESGAAIQSFEANAAVGWLPG